MPRLDRGIQYAAAYRFNRNCLGVLDRPVKPGDDSEDDAVENFRIAQAAFAIEVFHEAPM
ncbi:hypothetical protein E4K66_00440 [Bradyrhizobium frederickii]|uniref:Uncharacterized protein n=1 Tax=Bradyrhizobium frederickii TaxID=2560054 RepID=A0A4Y9LGK5_9BRAD|nr:hypothetical protein E4K66_00440 [Bradyrhizobium frederickii]